VRPVDEIPLLIQSLHGSVRVPQVVDETLEDALVVQEPQARLVVDLDSENGRVLKIPGGDDADEALGVKPEGAWV
jgi:hypothetical protein